MSDIQTALHIPKDTLVQRLTEVRDEEVAKREQAIADANAQRQVLLDKVAKLSPDQVANILDFRGGTKDGSVEKFVDDVLERGAYTTTPTKPSFAETQLDRVIRQLTMASDSTIEIKPTDSITTYL